MADLATLNHRLSLLRKNLPPRGIRVKSESLAWSQVQGVLSRGDIKLAEVLANVEEVSLSGWRKATGKCHLDVDFYVFQKWDVTRKLPWSILDLGIEPGYLELELNRALAQG